MIVKQYKQHWQSERPQGSSGFRLTNRRKWYDEDADDTDDTDDVTEDSELADEDSPDEEQPKESSKTINMSSAQLSERLNRATMKSSRELLDALGFKSVEEAKKVIEAQRKAEREKLGEKERLEADLNTANEAKTKAEHERDAAIRSHKLTLVRLKILEHSSDAQYPDDVISRIFAEHGEETVLTIINDGNTVDDGAVKAYVKEIREQRPTWFTQDNSPGSPSNNDGKPKDPKGKIRQQARLEAERRMSNNFG